MPNLTHKVKILAYNLHTFNKQMIDKIMNTKKTIIALSISTIMLTACGSGGGSGGGATSNNLHVGVAPHQALANPNQSTLITKAQEDKNDALTGSNAKVVVADTGADVNKSVLRDDNINRQMTISQNDQFVQTNTREAGSQHGSHMIQAITDNAPATRIEMYTYNPNNNESIVKVWRGAAEVDRLNGGGNIINNSYSSGRYDNVTVYRPFVQTLKNMIDGGALMFFAAGNDTNANPSSSSQIPLLDDSLRKGFVTVAGLHNNQMLYNRCGVAKNFCLSAEAYHTMVNADGSTVVIGGTSTATAHVSATAAQIRSRYDWMTNEQIRDTLFTTAIDAGAPGIDEVYGVGIMNADKAVNGYGKFNQQTALNVQGRKQTYYFDNNISGLGGLTKNGHATLVLNGQNTYSGANIINDGKLVLNNSNHASTLVNAGGTLATGDNRNISSGSITNNGKVESLSGANLTVNGNFTNGTNGVVDKAIGSTIVVNGRLELQGGTLNVVGVTKNYVTQAGKQENLITAQQGIHGSFANINMNAVSDLISNQVNVTNNGISVTTRRQDVGDVAMRQSAYVGKDTSVQNVTSLLNHFDKVVDNGGELTDAQAKIASQFINSRHLTRTLFENGTETTKHAVDNISQNTIKQNSTFVDKTQTETDSVWVDYGYNQSNLRMNGLKGESSDNTLTVGASKMFGNHIVGVAASNKNLSWRESFAGADKSVRTSGYGVDAAYIYNFKGYNIYTFLGFDWLKNHDFTKANVNQWSIGAGVNKWFVINKDGTIAVQPNIALQYVHTKSDDVNTTDTVAIRDLNVKQLVASIGAKINYQLNNNVSLFGTVNVERDLQHKASYNADYAGVMFENNSSEIGKTRYNVGVGVRYLPTAQTSLSVVARHEQGSHWKQNSVNATFAYKF